MIEQYCSELLIHAADVEGLCQGIDEELVERLGEWVSLPCTYAGGARGQFPISFLTLIHTSELTISHRHIRSGPGRQVV